MPVPEDMRFFQEEICRRLELFTKDLISQLRREPTVFYADPDTQPDLVAGSKPGDVAVWVDATGASQFRVLQ
jgi:hypothetical protein